MKVYGAGIDSEFGFCDFNAVITYEHTLAADDEVFIALRRDEEVINSAAEPVLGPS